jgi:ribosomal protein S18 acetylase RimI-like enzyme
VTETTPHGTPTSGEHWRDIQLRPAAPADAGQIAAVHVRSWQVGYRGLLPDEYLDRLRPEERAERYLLGTEDPSQPYTMVAIEKGAICGFATTAPARDSDAQGQGELCALYVDPASWGRGVGRALLFAAHRRLAGRAFDHGVLWVLVGNERAQRFYRAHGWAADGSRRLDHVWGAAVDEVRYRRELGQKRRFGAGG